MISQRSLCVLLLTALPMVSGLLAAQSPTPRLTHEIRDDARTVLPGSRSAIVRAASSEDKGALPWSRPIKGITLTFKRSSVQEAELQGLLAAQTDPSSAQFHHWLTPDEFAARFGLAEADLANVQRWIERQGFHLDSAGRSRDRITFSGDAGQVAQAFGTSLHRYVTPSGEQVAPAEDLSVPAELAPLVRAVLHLSTYRPTPAASVARPAPRYTTMGTQTHYLDPLDLVTQYDVSPLYAAGVRGRGQSIAIVGQSYVASQDFNSFVVALGLGSLSNYLVLVPNTGVDAAFLGDEAESDIDLEYSIAMAPGAQLFFVYVGDNPTYNVYDALRYAVSANIAPIISISYGSCEQDLSSAELDDLTATTQQANLQGQTVIAAAGDLGSNGCFYNGSLSSAARQTPSVIVPASLANVTSLGGLQMAAGTFSAGNTQYFSAANGTDAIASLLSYVPEVVWNEDSASHGRIAGGGGASTLVARPDWQTGVAGIPTGGFRLVPDLSLQSSVFSPGYIFCTSDPSAFAANQVNSCFNGSFFDSGNNGLNIAGGTSFAAPVFAGMLALLNQATHADGQGNVNPVLYRLAGDAGTYRSAFHDITQGGNQCELGAGSCSAASTTSFMAGVGYDEASGLGSIDLAKLVAAWPVTASTNLGGTETLVGLEGNTLGAGTSQTVFVWVNPLVLGDPTGTVKVLLDGMVLQAAAPLSGSSTQFSFVVPTSVGTHILSASYSGDARNAASRGSALFEVGSFGTTGSFNLSATNITIPVNGVGTGTITVTPVGGYTGAVSFSLSVSASTPALCYSLGQVSAYTGLPTPITLTLGTGTACSGSSATSGAAVLGMHRIAVLKSARTEAADPRKRGTAASIALGGLLLTSLCFWRKRGLCQVTLSLLLVTSCCFALSGCGSGSKGGGAGVVAPVQPAAQTLVLTVSGTDSIASGITSSTNLSVSVAQ